jgi:hypothetical protein
MQSAAEKRAYQRGYAAAARSQWPPHRPPAPPQPAVAALMAALRNTRDAIDNYLATVGPDETEESTWGPHVDAADAALTAVTIWLRGPAMPKQFEIVELHPAFSWDCPDCGRENFQRSVHVSLNPGRPEDAATIRRLEGWSEGDPIPESYGASFLTKPNRVTCRHCEKEYETADSGDQEVPEGESPFG